MLLQVVSTKIHKQGAPFLYTLNLVLRRKRYACTFYNELQLTFLYSLKELTFFKFYVVTYYIIVRIQKAIFR